MSKIVLVDDDVDIAESMRKVLESQRHEVIIVQDIDQAVSTMEEEHPDLVILDVMFPENPVAGFEACRNIKRNPSLQNIPIIVISAINEAYSMGFSSETVGTSTMPAEFFLEKPLDPQALIEAVQRAVSTTS